MLDIIVHALTSPATWASIFAGGSAAWGGYKTHQAGRANKALKAAGQNTQHSVERHDGEIAALKSWIEELKAERVEDKAEIVESKLKIARLEAESANDKAQIVKLQLRVAELERDLAISNLENQRLREAK